MKLEVKAKIEEYLKKHGFFQLSGKKEGVWVREKTPNMRTIDLNKTSTIKKFAGYPVVCISTGIERIEEGHGIGEIDDIRAAIMAICDDKTSPGAEKTSSETTTTPKEEPPIMSESISAPGGEQLPEFDKRQIPEPKETLPAKAEKPQPPSTKKLSDQQIDDMIEQEKARRFLQSQGGTYKVQGKERPDSAMIQKVSNKAGINIEILEAVQTDKFTHVVVRGRLGDQYVDAVVHHDFEIERRLKLMEIIAKNPQVLERWEGIEPVMKQGAKILLYDYEARREVEKDAMYYIVHALLSFQKFSIRDALTKCCAVTEAKLLNREFREEEEIKSEQAERELVQQSKNTKVKKTDDRFNQDYPGAKC